MKIRFSILVLLFIGLVSYSNVITIDTNGCENDLVILDTFPVDLDLLFCEDNTTKQDQRLENIRNGKYDFMITPYGGHFISSHVEGVNKWYLYSSDRYLDVIVPVDGEFTYHLSVRNDTILTINNNQTYEDVSLRIDIGNNCEIEFDHLVIRKTIADEILNTGKYTFAKGEHIGFADYIDSALDFYYYKNDKPICPFLAFNTELQIKISALYDLQYQAAKIGGTFPETKLCGNYTIDIHDTLWGVWSYHTGQFDSYFDDLDNFQKYAVSYVTLLNIDLTNPETFHKDPKNNAINLTSDIVGVFGDNSQNEDLPSYNIIGNCLVKQVSGTPRDGILELITEWEADWGPGNTSIYAKYSVDDLQDSYTDNIMDFECFSSLVDAQAGFTENKITYIRFVPEWDRPQGLGCNCLILMPISIILIYVLSKKWRK